MNTPVYSTQLAPLSYVVRLVILLAVISFERVVGLPILTLGLAFQWAELLGRRDVIFLVISTGILIAVYYQLSFALSIFLCGLGLAVIPLWVRRQRFQTPWVMGSILVMVGCISWWGEIPQSWRVWLAAGISFLILLFTRQWRSWRRTSTTWF
jgi:hypothetical protein